jgi:hypothetical protein
LLGAVLARARFAARELARGRLRGQVGVVGSVPERDALRNKSEWKRHDRDAACSKVELVKLGKDTVDQVPVRFGGRLDAASRNAAILLNYEMETNHL